MNAQTISAITEAVLESRLVDWAREYGGGKYVTLGMSTGEHVLARLIAFGGFLPQSSAPKGTIALTAADEVENIVKRMAKTWPAHARVLRVDYFAPRLAMESRLDALRRSGYKMGKSGYYVRLESAKLYVSGLL